MDNSNIQAIRATAILSVILFTKVFVTNIGLGGAKWNAGGRSPEDKYQTNAEEASEDAKAAQLKAQRIVNNDLENITYTLTLAWGALYCIVLGGSDWNAWAHIVIYGIFVFCRYGHSIAYMSGKSYLRTTFWTLGVTCSFAIGINGAVATFGIE
mmetsp:Transcript_32926/g.60355  ORF Transcript_32926/g.60355 Transcript_32926/m.60355 type:complete len:154 (-) Transcript_32926:84-545(-)|eukprot:CAMPEP_0201648440 /NCGR_PEP_ID=MMETSP0493-20130528/37625_1 /ASSEMBLY_ACC=CAM_ASM_000838 /TAXON_ID=420259 /ORGANISM="Thalassiosira gravida, Strain GMp14c1" /LENGTH=153 /DNA_ID=CAMNT_0048124085 /DNA_START=307 /DNA_END=768 /DNA_ORIENTATION=-